ncbi:protein mono-ADP-ribosyltransferase PARP4 isoform X2 [Hyperolius riggenbachi]|uniref:protein mono-ADP-ribosyltransferase PARP4 isoform X2 n=1 Tax=Hyperolius riggenbachi TaxID=752182 RepID=UPI0035A28690
MGVGLFSNCVFFLKATSLPFKEKSNLKNCITSNGGVISLVLNEKCTHVVVVSKAVLNTSQQKKIQKHSIPIVKPDYIWQSIQENRLAEVDLADDRKIPEVILEALKDDKKSKFREKFMKHIKAKRDFIHEEDCEEGGDNHDLPPDTEVAKYSFFQKGEEVAVLEILCFNEQNHVPYKISTVCGIPGISQELTFNPFKAAEKACDKYEQRMKDLENNGFKKIDRIPPGAEAFASQALQKVLLEEALNVTQLSPEVGTLVESFWTEALGHLTSVLSCPVENISLNDVSKAEGILQHVRNLLNKKADAATISEMMQEFYQCIPHKSRQYSNIDKKFLSAKQDLCQLIRDMVNVCETNSSRPHSSSVAKYRALRCRLEYVDPNTEEYNRVTQDVLENNHSNEEFRILRVFRIGRLSEAIHFNSNLGNVKSLLHASSLRNFVGILSRGLLLPKIIVDEFGVERTDIGNLGSGIYFSDSISTSVKYTDAGNVCGTRFLVVCDVALGKAKDVGKRDYTITEPPEGFHSMHGVRSDVWKNSNFVDDEYVVYNVDQVKMRYVVQFCTNKDKPKLLRKPAVTLEEENNEMTTCEPLEDISIDDLPEASTTKGGLQGKDGKQIPLESIYVKARLMDLAAQVIIFQTYKNDSLIPIEAKYVFPLDSTAAVCGFEAFINGKHIVGEVKEKQQAHREYRTAIREGHGAYLMDQDAPDVFTVSVGNLPAGATVIIKITYVTELVCCYTSSLDFSIPGSVASWQEDQALKENTQDTVEKVGIDSEKAAKGSFHLEMSIEMPRKIENVYCFSHTIKVKKTECKAVVRVEEGSSLTDSGFSLMISLEEGYIPRMWVETHPDKDSEACMLVFQPEFENSNEQANVTVLLDCSNSMESCFQTAKQVALLALSNISYLPINLVAFGSTSKELYFYPQKHKPEMETFIKMAKPNMGNTEFWKPLQSICLLRPSSGHQKVLLISDGHLQDDDLALQILKKHKNHITLFTCGVGAKANKHMLRCLARHGAGAFEYFGDKSKCSWISQMRKQCDRLQSPSCTAASVKWRLFGRHLPEAVQAPANIRSIFHNDSMIVYGFVSHCTQATLKALIDNKELENLVSTTELQKTTGTILHKLTARALIRDYEDGILREKEHENEMEKQKMKSFIIDISKEHSIVTEFTSFVAIEKRSAEESENIEPNIDEIISAEDVDILPYMEYKEEEDEDRVREGSIGADEESQDMMVGSAGLFSEAEEDGGRSSSSSSADADSDGEDGYLGAGPRLEEDSSSSSDSPKSYAFSGRRHFYNEPEEEEDSSLCAMDTLPMAVTMMAAPAPPPAMDTIPMAVPMMAAPPPPAPMSTPCRAELERGYRRCALSINLPSAQSDGLARSRLPTYFSRSESADVHTTKESEHMGVTDFTRDHTTLEKRMAEPEIHSSLKLSDELFSFSQIFPQEEALLQSSKKYMPEKSTPRFRVPQAFGSGMSAYSGSLPSAPGLFGTPTGTSEFVYGMSHSAAPPAPPAQTETSNLFGLPPALSNAAGAPTESSFKFGFHGFGMNTAAGHTTESPFKIGETVRKAGPSSATESLFWVASKQIEQSENLQQSRFPLPRSRARAPMPQLHHVGGLFGSSRAPTLSSESQPFVMDSEEQIADIGDLKAQFLKKSTDAWNSSIVREEKSAIKGRARFLPQLMRMQSKPQQELMAVQRRTVLTKAASRLHSDLTLLSWTSLSPLQSQEGYWALTPQLGMLLNINVSYLCDVFLAGKGISSLGSRGKDEILKLIATLLILQVVRTRNLLSGIKFKALMKLDQCDSASESFTSIEKAINWAVRTDRQYPGICSRMGLGRDWEHATRQLLNMEPPSSDLTPALY